MGFKKWVHRFLSELCVRRLLLAWASLRENEPICTFNLPFGFKWKKVREMPMHCFYVSPLQRRQIRHNANIFPFDARDILYYIQEIFIDAKVAWFLPTSFLWTPKCRTCTFTDNSHYSNLRTLLINAESKTYIGTGRIDAHIPNKNFKTHIPN